MLPTRQTSLGLAGAKGRRVQTAEIRRQYRLRRRIAVGGMAEVFLASLQGAVGFDRDVVIKRIHPRWADNEDVLSLFRDEARLGSRLNHPNVVQVLDYGRHGLSTYLVMEWVEGFNAADVIAAAEDSLDPLSPAVVASVGRETAAALEHIHGCLDDFGARLGIVHRDLNPANVLISFAGEVKITDFGVAAGHHRELKTEHGILRGTFPYMSPEQTRCRPLDGRSDLFSLGICLYEMLTGRHPFADEEDYLTIERIQDEEPPAPSLLRAGIDPALDAIVMRCLAKEPADRPDSARHLREDLDAWLRRTCPRHEGTSAVIRLMLRLFPRGVSGGEEVPSMEIELGPTNPGRAMPLLDVSSLQRRPLPRSALPPRRSAPDVDLPRSGESSVVRLDALLDEAGDEATRKTVRSSPSLEFPAPPTERTGSFVPETDDLHDEEGPPPWERARLRATMARTNALLTARGLDDPSSISMSRLHPVGERGRVRSLLPWISLSFAVVLLCFFAWLSQ